jgi:transcriptional regulator with XRE-family HTH domain
MMTRSKAKVELKSKGWSYRSVAPVLGISFAQLDRILNGRSHNPAIIELINSLPQRADWIKAHEHAKN